MAGLVIEIDSTKAERAIKALKDDLEKLGSTSIKSENKIKELSDRLINKMGTREAETKIKGLQKQLGLTDKEVLKLRRSIGGLRETLAQVKNKFVSVGSAAIGFVSKIKKVISGLFSLKNLFLTIFFGGMFTGVIKQILKIGSSFEKTMIMIEAILKNTMGELGIIYKKMIRDVRKLGQETEWTALQIADALKFMIMSGVSAYDALKSLSTITDLATAGQLDLARAADLATNAMVAFKLTADDLTAVSDAFISTATRSNSTVESLAEAFKYVSATASSMGFGINQTLALLGKLHDAGIQNSMAGTQLNQAFLRTHKILKKLGTDTDASNFVNILEEIKKQGWGIPEIMDVTAARGGRAILTLLKMTDGVRDLNKSIDEGKKESKQVAKSFRESVETEYKKLTSIVTETSLEIFETNKGSILAAIEYLKDVVLRIKRPLTIAFKSVTDYIRNSIPNLDTVEKFFLNLKKYFVYYKGLIIYTVDYIKSNFKTVMLYVQNMLKNMGSFINFASNPIKSIASNLFGEQPKKSIEYTSKESQVNIYGGAIEKQHTKLMEILGKSVGLQKEITYYSELNNKATKERVKIQNEKTISLIKKELEENNKLYNVEKERMKIKINLYEKANEEFTKIKQKESEQTKNIFGFTPFKFKFEESTERDRSSEIEQFKKDYKVLKTLMDNLTIGIENEENIKSRLKKVGELKYSEEMKTEDSIYKEKIDNIDKEKELLLKNLKSFSDEYNSTYKEINNLKLDFGLQKFSDTDYAKIIEYEEKLATIQNKIEKSKAAVKKITESISTIEQQDITINTQKYAEEKKLEDKGYWHKINYLKKVRKKAEDDFKYLTYLSQEEFQKRVDFEVTETEKAYNEKIALIKNTFSTAITDAMNNGLQNSSVYFESFAKGAASILADHIGTGVEKNVTDALAASMGSVGAGIGGVIAGEAISLGASVALSGLIKGFSRTKTSNQSTMIDKKITENFKKLTEALEDTNLAILRLTDVFKNEYNLRVLEVQKERKDFYASLGLDEKGEIPEAPRSVEVNVVRKPVQDSTERNKLLEREQILFNENMQEIGSDWVKNLNNLIDSLDPNKNNYQKGLDDAIKSYTVFIDGLITIPIEVLRNMASELKIPGALLAETARDALIEALTLEAGKGISASMTKDFFGVTENIRNLKEERISADWSKDELLNYFNYLGDLLETADYPKQLEIYNQQTDLLSEIADYNKELLEINKAANKTIDDLVYELTGGQYAPVQSKEFFEREMASLFITAKKGGEEGSGALSEYSSKFGGYADLMKAVSGNEGYYTNFIDATLANLEGLRGSYPTSISSGDGTFDALSDRINTSLSTFANSINASVLSTPININVDIGENNISSYMISQINDNPGVQEAIQGAV